MLYDLLATLWEGPADEATIARLVQARSGAQFSTQAAQRYLRMLSESGYVRMSEDPMWPRYDITPEGSTLLARMALEADSQETIPA